MMTAMGSRTSALRDKNGNRKYLASAERKRFLAAAAALDPIDRTLCEMLVYTGARCSEVIAIRGKHLEQDQSVIVIETLKQGQAGIYREVPVPPALLERLIAVHRLADAPPERLEQLLWPMSRWTVLRRVQSVMAAAGLHGPQATVRGLRHTFAIHAMFSHVPLNVVSRLMGHARLETTTLYLQVMTEEIRKIAAKMWESGAEGV